ncbi:MAG TPA: ABC transporter permease [Bryobacteraceae bacterium]|nr:ABC transporter permease [Bryobacteraceae bacterium]
MRLSVLLTVYEDMHSILRDVSYGLRLFRRNPAFSILAALILALGIGANTAIFSLIHAVILNPLPYRNPGNLCVLWSDFSQSGGNRRAFSAPANYFDWRDRNRSFQSLTAYANTNRTFTALDQPITSLTHEVTASYFDVLGVPAFRGRTFLPGEDQPGRDRVVIISHSLWVSAFGASDAAIGKTVELDGQSAQVIGVLPAGFRVPNNGITVQPDLWMPASFETLRLERAYRNLVAFGRLNPGVALGQARAELSSIADRIARENPLAGNAAGVSVELIRDAMTQEFRSTFILLLGAVFVILLIACANVANLLLARSTARSGELAVRAALGASRGQMLRQLLVESLTLSLIGSLAGILIAHWSIAPLLHLVPDSAGLPFADQAEINLPVLAFALGLSVFTAMIFGLAPARHALRLSLVEVLKEGGRSRTAGRAGSLWRSAMIVAEVGLSLTLLMGAGLMMETLWRLSHLDFGFDPSRVLTLRNSLRGEAYRTPAARRSHFQNAVAKLAAIPGVQSVSGISFPPPLTLFATTPFVRSDRPSEPGRETAATTLTVLPGYFETMRIPILSGRDITQADSPDTSRVAVVSRTLVKRYFPDADPIGHSIRIVGLTGSTWRIVGVAGDVRSAGLGPDPQPLIYFPYAQDPVPVMSWVMRTRVDPATIGGLAENTLWSLGRMMNVYAVLPLEQRIAESYWQSRFTMILLSLFAALALVLSTAGIYAVISYLTAQRTREIGIRMALGARPADVLRMVTAEGIGLAILGVLFGVIASLGLGRLIASRLYGVAAADPLILASAAMLMLLVTAAACAAPAVRAARIDPVQALHSE